MLTRDQRESVGPESWPTRLYARSVPLQARLAEIAELLGNPFDRTLLDLSGDYGATSYHLRRLGGTWHSADLDAGSAASLTDVVGERTQRLLGAELPFEEAAFDAVVVTDTLERLAGDGRLIAECHRVLKPLGRLIVVVPHLKRWTVLRPLRRLLGLTAERQGRARPGYTESQLFDLLKDGFDVELARTYNRFFVELLDTVVQGGARRGVVEVSDRPAKALRWYVVLYPFFKLAAALDILLPFTRGYSLVVRARRRPWRPRRAPVLSDGRSIAEAALGGKIGTAAPF